MSSPRAYPLVLAISITCSACANGGGAAGSRGQWEDIDYSKVYKAAGQRDVDSSYKLPTVAGCVDDDLYNCK